MSQMSHQVAKCDMTPTACNRGSRVMFCIAHHLQVVRRCFQVPVKNKINLKLCTETWEPRTWFADKLWQCSRWIGWVMLCMEEAGTGENTPWLSVPVAEFPILGKSLFLFTLKIILTQARSEDKWHHSIYLLASLKLMRMIVLFGTFS